MHFYIDKNTNIIFTALKAKKYPYFLLGVGLNNLFLSFT